MSTTTPNKLYVLQNTGENSNTWGSTLNTNFITFVDTNLGGRLSLSVAGSANVTLSATQAQNAYYTFTGVLTGNITVFWPATAGGSYIVFNNTTGAFTLTVAPTGGSGLVVTQAQTNTIFINPDTVTAVATNTTSSSSGTNLTLSGTLSVGSTSTLTGAVTMSSTAAIAGNLSVNTNKFTVTAASGNTLVAGTLSTTGQATLSGNAYPTTNGSNLQFLQTNGSGTLSWATITGATATAPTTQTFTSGSSATYTTPANVKWIKVRMVGGGGGGGAQSTNNGTGGGTSTFNSVNAVGGSGGTTSAGGAGGTGGTGTATLRIPGQAGTAGLDFSADGGNSYLGFGGRGSTGGAGVAAAANSGGGGGGASSGSSNVQSAGGGGGGEYLELVIGSPAATYTYTVGAKGTGGAAGGLAGGDAGAGLITVEEHYNY